MKYGSLCSGIEAATTAWHPLGWQPAFFSEIEPFPSAVLAHHYPTTTNLGDMTKFKDWQNYAIDVLVGGTPCQSFSVAGLRKGLADPRGNLMLTYLAIAARYRPRWLVWENVPGVLSSNGGKDFGTLLGGLGELGYGFAYRILDAQYVRVESHARAVPQRRRRVFVVGCLGDWRRAAAVLFERESLCGNPPPRRHAREGVAPTLSARTKGGGGLGTDFDLDGGQTAVECVPEIAGCLNSAGGHAVPGNSVQDADQGYLIAHSVAGDARTLLGKPNDSHADDLETYVAHSLRAEGFDASEDGTGRATPLVAQTVTADMYRSGGAVAGNNDQGVRNCIIEPVPIGIDGGEVAFALRAEGSHSGDKGDGGMNTTTVATSTAVRRLMPRECERLQGFPDNFTRIPSKLLLKLGIEPDPANDKHWAADGPRYKALGNSMAVNCMRWIGDRIQQVENLPLP